MSAKKFIEEMHDTFMVNPIAGNEFIMFRHVFVCIEEAPSGKLELISIRSVRQGHGIASKAIDELLHMADKHGVEIFAFCSPMPHWAVDKKKAMSREDLIEWYRRHGFCLTQNGYVHYYPQRPRRNFDQLHYSYP